MHILLILSTFLIVPWEGGEVPHNALGLAIYLIRKQVNLKKDNGRTSGLGMQPQPKQEYKKTERGAGFMLISDYNMYIVTVYEQHT